jgi:Putative phage tail protein
MASLALGVAGAAVGSFFGPLGTSIGWAVGSALGGALFAKGQHGPRLNDLRVQNSAYGQVIPIGYGTIRVAGNVIWSTDLIEEKKKSSGKGGPKITTYSYSVSFAVALCEGPIVGLLRIWADGRLIYGEGSSGVTLPMTLYLGDETQLPDPTMEAEEGVGNVPAHRGTAYVVFTALQLAEFGNRIPNLSFEVIASGALDLVPYSEWAVDYDYPIDASAYSYPYLLNGVEPSETGLILHRYRSGFDYGANMGTGDDNVVYYDRSEYDLHGALLSSEAQASVAVGDASSNARVWGAMTNGIAYVTWQIDIDCGSGPETFNTFAWMKDGVVTYTPSDLCAVGQMDRQLGISGGVLYWNGNVYALAGGNGYPVVRRWPAPDGSCYEEDFDASFSLDTYTHDSAVSSPADLILGDDGYLYVRVSYLGGASPDVGVLGEWGVKLVKLDADLNLVGDWYDPSLMTGGVSTALGVPGYSSAVIYRGHYISYQSAGVLNIANPHFVMYRIGTDSFTFVDELLISDPSAVVGPLIYIGGGLAAHRGGILQLGSSGITLAEIVGDVSDRCRFAVGEYDVAALIDQVRGYTVSQRMSGRSAIEALQPAYQFGAVESNLVAKFVKWGGEITATIPADDLGARPADDDAPDPLAITHGQDADLPRVLDAVYLNVDMDYQEGTQTAQRMLTTSDVSATIALPIVLTNAEAKAMADVLLFNAWMERDRFSFSLPRKWAHIEPTDVVSVDGHAIRITGKDESGYTHIAFEGVATRTGVFVSSPVPAPPIGFVPQVPPSPNHTDLLLLDIPLVSDVDYSNGFYAVFAGRMDGAWPGAALFKSIDGGVEYESIYSTVETNTLGVATTILGTFTGGNVFDEINTVTIRLTPGSGTLSSSNSLGVLNGANRAMLGDELIQFRTAALVSARTYTLSGLLRGRRGTEWAIALHAANEDFVLLPAQNVEGLGTELGQSRYYKAVTQGSALSSAAAVTFTNTGVALKPYAPVQLGGGRNGSGDVTLTWVRRTRIGGAWLDNNDVPLSETQEYYAIGIYGSGYATFKRWLTSSTPTVVYTAANQTTDFGSLQGTVYFTVLQWGTFGYGYEARGTA